MPNTNTAPNTIPFHYTIPQFAGVYQVHPNTVRNWIREDRLRVVRIGKTIRILGLKSTAEESGNAEGK